MMANQKYSTPVLRNALENDDVANFIPKYLLLALMPDIVGGNGELLSGLTVDASSFCLYILVLVVAQLDISLVG